MRHTNKNYDIEEITQKISDGERIDRHEALFMLNSAPLWLLGKLATEQKIAQSGNKVFYNRNFHIEPTNICSMKCKFCSFRRSEGESGAWDLSLEQILDIVKSRQEGGFTEVHITGGVHPTHTTEYYAQMIRAIKKEMPKVTIKAFTAIELAVMFRRDGLSDEHGLKMLIEAGMGTIPGGGAEIFSKMVRMQICPEKGDAEMWLDMHHKAHDLGLKTNATMLYGHIESAEDRIDHLDRLRELQDETGGFNAFIPLKYRRLNNSMYGIGEASIIDDMRTLAMSRIYLDNFPHIKAYWVMYGKQSAELALSFGADDVDGTIGASTKIYSMAGAEEQPSMSIE